MSLTAHGLSTGTSSVPVGTDSVYSTVEHLDDVTVTARRPRSGITAGMPVQTITSENIATLGLQNMADAVRRFAGANVKDYGGIGGLKTVSVRNMGAAHTGVSYDGAPVSNCQGGQIDIGRFSLDNVSSLTLAIGQNSDLLQPAKLYSSAAVLGITTVRPEFLTGRNSSFQIEAKGGSFGYVSPSARWCGRWGRHVVTSLEGSFLRADGNYPFTLVNGKYVTRERRNNSDIDSWHTEANIYLHTGYDSELMVKGYYFYSRRGLPGSVTLYNPISTETLWDKNAFLQIKYRTEISPRWQFQTIGKYNYGWNRDREFGAQFTGGMYEDIHRQDEYYISASATFRPLDALILSLAQDGAMNKLESTMSDCPYPTRYSSYTAFNARWRRGAITATATMLGTYITEHVRQGSRPKDIHRLSPSFSISIQPWQEEMLFFRAMYKNTFRTPSFNDLYYYRLGNRSLRPEKATEYNIGVTWSKSFMPVMDYLSLTVDGYFNDVTDKIVAFPTTYTWRMVNYGDVHITGVDLTLAASFSLPYGIHASLSGSYTYQKALDLTDPASKNYKAQLPYTPCHTGNVAATVETPWVTVAYSIVGVGMRYHMSQNIPANEIGGYTDHTLAVSRSLRFRGLNIDLRGEIANLTDKQYDVIKYYPMPGRSWRFAAKFRF